jgi:hypothetical protein
VCTLQVLSAVSAIEFSTRYSQACCRLIAENGGVAALLMFMRTSNRSDPHKQLLIQALAILDNICRQGSSCPPVQAACLPVSAQHQGTMIAAAARQGHGVAPAAARAGGVSWCLPCWRRPTAS